MHQLMLLERKCTFHSDPGCCGLYLSTVLLSPSLNHIFQTLREHRADSKLTVIYESTEVIQLHKTIEAFFEDGGVHTYSFWADRYFSSVTMRGLAIQKCCKKHSHRYPIQRLCANAPRYCFPSRWFVESSSSQMKQSAER
jgi:hypothetical protein